MPEAPKHRISPRAKRVWARLGEWYGTKLAEQYGPFPPEDWCEVVDRNDNEDIKRGLNLIRSEFMSWPPTLPQFESAIRPADHSHANHGPTIPEQLTDYVLKTYRLTVAQQRLPWAFIGRTFDAPGQDGKMRSHWGVEYTGVIVPADGDAPGYRVMVEDMQLGAQAA